MAIKNFDFDEHKLRIKERQDADNQENLNFAINIAVEKAVGEKIKEALEKNQ